MVGQTIIPRDETITVGTSSVELSPETGTKQRQALVITNTSTALQKVALAWGKDAVALKGVVLLPGEHHVEAIDSAFTPLNSRISAIADGAGATVAIHERLISVVR
jgi:hypothetical protein